MFENDESYLSTDVCPLVNELKRLKKSSSEAVDNDEEFSPFKMYMHIHRSLEDDLVNKIEQAKKRAGKSLILVCGNVGDGKSHVISYLKHTRSDLLDGFIIHNDATESRSPNRDEKEELAMVLHNFRDDCIANDSDDKIIVAINLGVLSNFIDSEKGKGRVFSKLAEYVNSNNILIDNIVEESHEQNSCFFHINFGDYHIFRLNDGRIDSPYIEEVIDRIVFASDKNPFYLSYKRCSECSVEHCPVKANFEMLQNKKVVSGIINILIETIFKDKVILSTRELLDFFYDIIVHPDFNKSKLLKSKNKPEQFIKYCLPSLMYEHEEASMLLSHLTKYDFINQRTEQFDGITTRFNTTDKLTEMFEFYIDGNPILNQVFSFDINTLCEGSASKSKELKKSLFVLFTRLCKITPKQSDFSIVNEEFNDFIADLYCWIRQDKKKLQKIYKTVEKCIYEWNGGSYGNKCINLRSDVDGYIVSTKLDLEPDLSRFTSPLPDEQFDRFPSYINLVFTKKNEKEKAATISIDYDLYKMLKLVENGYRPSANDNNHYIGFLTFINRLAEFSGFDEEIIIQSYIRDENKQFTLRKDGFGYTFSEVK